jgi:hypothetical protein
MEAPPIKNIKVENGPIEKNDALSDGKMMFSFQCDCSEQNPKRHYWEPIKRKPTQNKNARDQIFHKLCYDQLSNFCVRPPKNSKLLFFTLQELITKRRAPVSRELHTGRRLIRHRPKR